MRKLLTSAMELAGAVLLSMAAFMVAVPLGCAVAGVLLIAGGVVGA